MARELEKTLLVDGEEYHINAKTAEEAGYVQNSLVINKSNYDKTTSQKISFDGSTPQTLLVVPADDGGRFNKRIFVPAEPDSTTIDDEAVLNYGDIKAIVVPKLINTSILYAWDGAKLDPTLDKTEVCSISLITGDELLIMTFADHNFREKLLPAYLYVCSGTGNLYFGTYDSSNVTKLATTTSDCNMSVNLESDDTQLFDGTQDSLSIGVTGTLPIEHGGTGATTKEAAVEKLVKDQFIAPARIKIAKDHWVNVNDYGFDVSNSDIININGLFFDDPSMGAGEGINFIHTRNDEKPEKTTYDILRARDGVLYFAPNNVLAGLSGTKEFEIYHAGGAVIPVTKGGTGQTDLNKVTVGNANKVKVSYKASTSTAVTNKYANITIAPSASYPNGPTGGADGDIMILF